MVAPGCYGVVAGGVTLLCTDLWVFFPARSGMAADIRVNGMTPKQVANILNEIVPDECGIIVYKSWVHFDVRKSKYRKGI
jgi:hypothetical protein